jgi:predicted CoA-binding protein
LIEVFHSDLDSKKDQNKVSHTPLQNLNHVRFCLNAKRTKKFKAKRSEIKSKHFHPINPLGSINALFNNACERNLKPIPNSIEIVLTFDPKSNQWQTA